MLKNKRMENSLLSKNFIGILITLTVIPSNTLFSQQTFHLCLLGVLAIHIHIASSITGTQRKNKVGNFSTSDLINSIPGYKLWQFRSVKGYGGKT